MKNSDCEKFAILAALESQLAILLYAKEEGGRLRASLKNSSSSVATSARAAVEQQGRSIDAILKTISAKYHLLQLAGGKFCDIDYSIPGDLSVCYVREPRSDCHCQLSVADLDLTISNIWAT